MTNSVTFRVLLLSMLLFFLAASAAAWSGPAAAIPSTRRGFLSRAATMAAAAAAVPVVAAPAPAWAAPEVLETPQGVKYVITKAATSDTVPRDRDIVAIEYTGYLSDGTIFDATHAAGKRNALMFEVGGNAVIPGLNELLKSMRVGEKVQAIVPPQLAFGEKGICLESGECLVKPNATLVYDVYLKTSAIPPP